jgi:hypothetical protein
MAVAKAALHIIDLGKMAMPMVAIHINHFRSCSHLDSGLFILVTLHNSVCFMMI